jgi:uncharacterized protein
MPVADKKLHWIHGTTARWDGYLEFQRRPQPILISPPQIMKGYES